MKTHNKKPKNINPQTSQDKNNFDEIPLDLVIEIIKRFPAKSVAKFLVVSKLWATIIRSRDFIKSFPIRSFSQPRFLFAFSELDRQRGQQNWYFFSCSSSLTSLLSRLTCPFPKPKHIVYPSHYVNGLISLGCGQEQIICNPTTGKSITLAKVKTRRRIAKSFFGYELLCMTEKLGDAYRNLPSSQHQVITIGSQKSWRMIDCNVPHRPWSNGVCIDDVRSLMRFDLRSEKLEFFTGLSTDIKASRRHGYTLITYEGKVAITSGVSYNTFDVWMMEKHGWLKKSFSVHVEPVKVLLITGTTHKGEFILVPYYSRELYVILYDLNRSSFRKIKIEVNPDHAWKRLSTGEGTETGACVLSDYVESIRFL
ncbi:hypothetical protein EUTSA_v10019453mg [Eutrema salsugineum]|uniref:F-box domain-containing protein n=1 Tax=Eutrema salsugineum TaxID=72664 RepID=V4JTN4_EUTSA|nr:hypothetical protein EUTSA_v10019453mg [Eutrema salsugineum]